MSRSGLIISICAAIAGTAAVTPVVLAHGAISAIPQISEEQRAAREKFFGAPKEPTPIEKGQEMRPRW